MLLAQRAPCAFIFDWLKAGSSMLARIPMIAMTTSSSIRVKPKRVALPGCCCERGCKRNVMVVSDFKAARKLARFGAEST